MADSARTDWQRVIGDRDVTITKHDREAARARFESETGRVATAGDAAVIRSMEREIAQNIYDDSISAAIAAYPITDAAVLKSLLYQESNLNGSVGINSAGFGGIAQLGKAEARVAGLRVDENVDDRLDPSKAIGAAALTLQLKDRALHGAFERYGRPTGDERTKFDLAAYNGGEGTIVMAMKLAYEKGLATAQAHALTGEAAVAAARSYATHFDNLREPTSDPQQSPLYRAADHYLSRYGADPHEKYTEIGEYADNIIARARQNDSPGVRTSPPLDDRHSNNDLTIHGEIRDGAILESAKELQNKNAIVGEAVRDAKRGKTLDFRFVGDGRESAREVALQNEKLAHAIEANLPDDAKLDLTKRGDIAPVSAPTPISPGFHVESAAKTMAAFEKDWQANAKINPRSGKAAYPELRATLDQKNATLTFGFTDAHGTLHSATMNVGETSDAMRGRYDAAHVLPGKYHLGNFAWAPGAGALSDAKTGSLGRPYGWADIPITMRDGTDHIPVVLKTGHVGEGTYERLHGGGSSLGIHAEDARQPIVPTLGCVRGENQDVLTVAELLKSSSRPIDLTITRDAHAKDVAIERSTDGGKTWSALPRGTTTVGTIHPTSDPKTVEIIVRGGSSPQTIAFKTEELGFTKQQIAEIAKRDPGGRIAIGTDEYAHPVVNAKADADRVPTQQRERMELTR